MHSTMKGKESIMTTYKIMYKNAVLFSFTIPVVIMAAFGLVFLIGLIIVIDYMISTPVVPTIKFIVGRVMIVVGLLGFIISLIIRLLI